MNSSWQPRAFVQRFFLALLVTAVFTATGIGMAYWVAADKIDGARTAEFAPDTLDEAGRGEPANFLIIGSDSRAFIDNELDEERFGDPTEQTGQRSDTIMIAHVDPDTEQGMLVSFPRDLWVQIPGRGEARLNTAFSGGPQLVVDTIKQNFDLPINHYLEIDFAGFRNLVDAIGTVPIYFPTPARDLVTGLTIDTAGCHRLDGTMALNYARSRKYEYLDEDGDWVEDGTADLGRIRRQQYFIRSLANEAVKSGFRNPTKILDIIDKTVDNITRDPDLGLSDIRALANTFREIDPTVVEMVTVPTERVIQDDGQDTQEVIESEAAPIFERLRSFGTTETEELPEGVVPSEVSVTVMNGSGVSGQARAAFDQLASSGFAVVGPPGNADRNDYETTLVQHTADGEDQAKWVVAYLGGAGELEPVDTLPDGVDVNVVLGRDFESVVAPSTTVAGAPTTATTVAGPPPNPGGEAALPPAGC